MLEKIYIMHYNNLSSLSNLRYSTNLIHIVAYFKKIWKPKLKQAWLEYYFITLSEKSDKHMANNWFNKKIILINKKKVCLFANVNIAEVFREIILINIILL